MNNNNDESDHDHLVWNQDTVENLLEQAEKQMKIHLQNKFPSFCDDGKLDQTRCVVFYSSKELAAILETTRELIEAEFLSKFKMDKESETWSLRNDLHAILQPVKNQYIEKNSSLRKKSQGKADYMVENLLKEYLAAMQKYFKRLKRMTIGTLEGFSKVELEKVEAKFMETKLGPPEFMHEWLDQLRDKVLKEFKTMKLNLELDHTILLGIRQFDMEIRRNLKSSIFIEGEEFQKLITSTEKRVFLQQNEHLEKNGAPKDFSARFSEAFHLKVKESMNKFINDNEKKEKIAMVEAEKLMENCISGYELAFNQNFDSLSELDSLREKYDKFAVEKFLNETKLRNKKLIDQHVQRLNIRLNQISDEIQTLLELKIQSEDNALFSVSQKIQKAYIHLMDKHFSKNRMRYFDLEMLKKMNNNMQKSALEKSEIQLTSVQTEKIQEHLGELFRKYKEQNIINKHSSNNDDVAIGIDLGTTYCCVAIYHMGQVKIIRNSLGDNTTPSYVTIDANGSYLVGKTAKEKSFRNPECTIFDAKRIIGRRLDDEKLREDMVYWPFVVEEQNSKAKVKVHEKYYHPEQILAMILKHLKLEAQEIMGLKIGKAVITVPAYFTNCQRQATVDAGQLAGLEVLAILNEPTAAAVAYRMEWYASERPRNILIYDLGGGTFDVAVLEISTNKIDVLSIGGDSQLGGEDFDKSMMNYCIKEFKKETGIDLLEGTFSHDKRTADEYKRSLKRLQLNCEIAKKHLSTARTTTISIDEIVRGKDMCIDIRRETFVDINSAFFTRTMDIVDEALKSARIKKDAIDDIILVGGSTRIRKLQQMLNDHFGSQKINKRINPDEAVAYGAAVQAAILNASPGSTLFDFGKIQEITPLSLGIEVVTREMDIFFPKNTKYPTKFKQKYRTNRNGQTTASIRIFQGENTIAEKNKLLGNFDLEGIPPGPAGAELVDVTMAIDRNGILIVEAICISTNGKNCITVNQQKGRLSEKEKHNIAREEFHVSVNLKNTNWTALDTTRFKKLLPTISMKYIKK